MVVLLQGDISAFSHEIISKLISLLSVNVLCRFQNMQALFLFCRPPAVLVQATFEIQPGLIFKPVMDARK